MNRGRGNRGGVFPRGRGRGRGAVRGRGRGRGRGYNNRRANNRARGGYGARGRGNPININEEILTVEGEPDENKQEEQKDWSNASTEDMHNLILKDHGIKSHLMAFNKNKSKYIRTIKLFVHFKIMVTGISTSTKAKILATLLIKGEKNEAEWLLKYDNIYSVGEIARCISILDAPRASRQYKKKLNKLIEMKKKNHKSVKDLTISKLRTKIHNYDVDSHDGSLNGCKIKILLRWLQNLSKEKLEFFLLNFGPENWKLICDLLHPNPKDFKCKYFQKAIYNENEIPENSLVYQAKKIDRNNVNELMQKYSYLTQCYSYIRKKLLDNSNEAIELENKIKEIVCLGFTRHEALCALNRNHNNLMNSVQWLFDEDHNNKEACKNMNNIVDPKHENQIPNETKHAIAENAPIDEVLWWYHELHSNEAEEEITLRLQDALKKNVNIFNDTSQRSNYGKLMDKILTFKEQNYKFIKYLIPFAERRLNDIKMKNIGVKCAILGDASGSMEVAIRSACIIASLLSVSLNADLKFFNSKVYDPVIIPRNVNETMKVVEKTNASGGTCMASALNYYYEKKIKIDLFILVSDEGENEKYNNYYFATLFKKYVHEINKNCRLFLVSFLKVGDDGQINIRLKKKNLKNYQQFRLHPTHPDTSKFDALLGRIAIMIDLMKELNYFISDIFMTYYYQYFENKNMSMEISNTICSFL